MPMAKGQIKALLKERGWTAVDVAARWGISVTWMSRLMNEPLDRPPMYDDAFRGLPARTAVAVKREARHVRVLKKRPDWDMFPVGRLFEALDSQVLDEGTQLVVVSVSSDRAHVRFRVRETGELVDIATVDVDGHFGDLCRDEDD